MRFTATKDQITIVHCGKTYVVRSDAPNAPQLRAALERRDFEEAVRHIASAAQSVAAWSRTRFELRGAELLFDGKPMHGGFARRVFETKEVGGDSEPLLRFHERLAQNPSKRSVDSLWAFLDHVGIPIEPDGRFLAYKGVRADYLDKHSGKICNRPGSWVQMPRNEISDDPNHACHTGLHVGSLEYARSYCGERIVVCRVDPADVVCVPHDASHQKMRTCRYYVAGNFGEQLPSTTFDVQIEECDEAQLVDFEAMMSESVLQLLQRSVRQLESFLRQYLFVVGPLPQNVVQLVDKILKVR